MHVCVCVCVCMCVCVLKEPIYICIYTYIHVIEIYIYIYNLKKSTNPHLAIINLFHLPIYLRKRPLQIAISQGREKL